MTMTPEQRAQSRAICDAAPPAPYFVKKVNGHWLVTEQEDENGIAHVIADCCIWEKYATFIAHARTALPAALYAIDACVEKLEAFNSGVFMLDGELDKADEKIDKLEAARDHWKSRAEALERALKTSAGKCYPCVHKDTSYEKCKECERSEIEGGPQNPHWQFDTARFTPAT